MNGPTGLRGKIKATGTVISKETGKVRVFTFEGETEMSPEEFQEKTGIPLSEEQPKSEEEGQ